MDFSKEDGGGLVRIDGDDVTGLNLRRTIGNETGANSLWIPGGYTSGNVPEAITDIIPLKKTTISRVRVGEKVVGTKGMGAVSKAGNVSTKVSNLDLLPYKPKRQLATNAGTVSYNVLVRVVE